MQISIISACLQKLGQGSHKMQKRYRKYILEKKPSDYHPATAQWRAAKCQYIHVEIGKKCDIIVYGILINGINLESEGFHGSEFTK